MILLEQKSRDDNYEKSIEIWESRISEITEENQRIKQENEQIKTEKIKIENQNQTKSDAGMCNV